LVAGTIADSPAAKAGLQAGDLITQVNDKSIPAARAPEDIPLFNRIILESPISSALQLIGSRAGKEMKWTVTTEAREPMQPREKELLHWGITARDFTKLQAKQQHRDNNNAAIIQSIRAGGPTAAAKPAPVAGDLIVKVNDTPIKNLADLEKITAEITKDATEPVLTLVTYERDGDSYLTIIKVGPEENDADAAIARKAWMGVSTQVISLELAEALGIPGQKGMRVTRVYPDSNAEKAGLKNGDLLLKLDGEIINASRPEDADVFSEAIRQMSSTAEATLELKRDKELLTIKVPLERAPTGNSELEEYLSETLEFQARDIGAEDRAKVRDENARTGVLISSVTNAGWAALAGLQNNDILQKINGQTITSIAKLKTNIEKINQAKPSHITFFVRRGITTRMIELEPTW
jgi:serine protease Do